MFNDTDKEGSTFPKAMTMLEATSEANNRNAYDIAKNYYIKEMDKIAGISSKFIKEYLLLVNFYFLF